MAVAGKINLEVDDGTIFDQREICEMCEHSSSAGYCTGCEGYLCQSCYDGHVKRKIYRNHVLQDAPESKEDASALHFKTCTEHKQQEVRIFCNDHQCFGCAECILLKHKTCKWEYITDASKKYQESGELARFIEDIQTMETSHAEITNLIASETEQVNKVDKTNVSDVQQSMKNAISFVEEEEKRLFDDAKVKKSINNKKIDKVVDDLKELGTEIKSISVDVKHEDNLHELFILAIETKPKISKIKAALASIDCNNVIDRYTFHPNRLLRVLLSRKQPLGKLTDNTQSEDEDDVDFERKYNAECTTNQQLKQQLTFQDRKIQVLTSENDDHRKKDLALTSEMRTLKVENADLREKGLALTSEMRKLKVENDDLRKKDLEVTLACGHRCSIEKMTKERTIQCATCRITFGDQPFGTLKMKGYQAVIEMHYEFAGGLQSKLNLNPGKPYTNLTEIGYLRNCENGQLISSMLRLAFNRRLLFTINTSGQIVPNGIDILNWDVRRDMWRDMWRDVRRDVRWGDYYTRVKEQLKQKGITEEDVRV